MLTRNIFIVRWNVELHLGQRTLWSIM